MPILKSKFIYVESYKNEVEIPVSFSLIYIIDQK